MRLRIEVPTAAPAGGPIEQTVWDEFLFNVDGAMQGRLTFPRRAPTPAEATLLVRARNADEPTIVPRDQWEFVDAQTIRLKPAAPFRIGAIYQLIYKAADPPVAGIGFAATRDLVSFLRYAAADDAGTANPLAAGGRPAVDRALAHGTSQSGRYLRDFVYRGFNEDESSRIVFEGINPHVATARLFLNHRFAQPNRMVHIAHGFMFFPDVSFPFAYETQTDPFTGTSDGILARCTARGNCPKVIHTNTGTEYWQSGQSLITTDALGSRDGAVPETVRIYHFAGTQHVEIQTMPKGVCATPYNTVDYRPLLRATLVALDRWVKDGTAPPPSRHPRIADGSLVHDDCAGVPIPGLPTGERARTRGRASTTARTSARASSARPCRSRSRTATGCWCPTSMPTATRRRASAFPTSRFRPQPRPDGRCAPRGPARPASFAISTALRCRSRARKPSARQKATRGHRWRSDTAIPPTTRPRCRTRRAHWRRRDIFCRKTRSASPSGRLPGLGRNGRVFFRAQKSEARPLTSQSP